jgi:hypothetical protein
MPTILIRVPIALVAIVGLGKVRARCRSHLADRYRLYAGRRQRALQIATGTSRTYSNRASRGAVPRLARPMGRRAGVVVALVGMAFACDPALPSRPARAPTHPQPILTLIVPAALA